LKTESIKAVLKRAGAVPARIKDPLTRVSKAAVNYFVAKSLLSWLVQLSGFGCVVYGISIYSHPIAFIIGGVAGIAAVEMQNKGSSQQSPQEVLEIQNRIKQALVAGVDPFAQPGIPMTPTWIAYAASLRKRT
jgi:hypothetical protein